MSDNFGRLGMTTHERTIIRTDMRKCDDEMMDKDRKRKKLRMVMHKDDPTGDSVHVDGPMPDFPKKKTKKQANPAEDNNVIGKARDADFCVPSGRKKPFPLHLS